MWFIQGLAGLLLAAGTILVLHSAWKADAGSAVRPAPAQHRRIARDAGLDESTRRAA